MIKGLPRGKLIRIECSTNSKSAGGHVTVGQARVICERRGNQRNACSCSSWLHI